MYKYKVVLYLCCILHLVSCHKGIYLTEMHEVNNFYKKLFLIVFGNENIVKRIFKLIMLLYNNSHISWLLVLL